MYLPFKMKKNDLLLDCHMRFRVTGISELQAPFGPKPHLDKRGSTVLYLTHDSPKVWAMMDERLQHISTKQIPSSDIHANT